MLERLHFEPGVMRYKTMDASEHLSRYLCVRELCRGRRVLDVACGEGYGAWLMHQWGAAQVVGIDISQDAIRIAERHFGAAGILFEQGDALALDSIPGFDDGFDIVVSFETIEHVDQPRRLLDVLKNLVAPGGVILVSCPNGAIEERMGHNPYHTSRFSMEAFRKLAEEILGEASQWLLGVPHTGFATFPVDFPQLRNTSESATLLVQGTDLALSPHVLPAEANCSIDPCGCSYFVGVWGSTNCRAIVVAPQSWECMHAPWQSIDAMQAQITMLESRVRQERRSAQIDVEQAKETVQRLQEDLQHAGARLEQAERDWTTERAHAERAWTTERAQAELARTAERAQADAAAQQLTHDLHLVRSELQLIMRSRIYRFAQRYYMLYRRTDLLGALMRGARRIAGKLRRAWRA